MPGDGRDPGPPYEGVDGEGSDLGRILSLSDGVFGFSMTLLVVTLALPAVIGGSTGTGIYNYLGALEPALLSYALAFMVIAGWWGEHHRVFSAIRRYDNALFRLNTVFLLTVSITPFMLAVVHVYGPTGLFDRSNSAILSVTLFGLVELLTGALLLLIWRHATRDFLLVDRSLPTEWVRFGEAQCIRRVLLFLVAVLAGFALPIAGELLWISPMVARRWRPVAPPRRSAPAPSPTSAALP